MHIDTIEAQGFRNLEPLQLELGGRPVLVRGKNAQGKTNLLEALYVCATGRSFRGAPPRQLLRHGLEHGRLAARFSRQGVRHDIEVTFTGAQRQVQVDGRNLRQVTRLLELVNVVAFFPDDLRIAKGSPEERRRFLDRAIANHRPDFVDAAVAYAKVLKARNALLRAPATPDRLLLETYDEQLVRHGAVLHACRTETLRDLAPLVERRFDEVMQSPSALSLRLASGIPDGPGDFAPRLAAALQSSYPRDRARGLTSTGPHRADLLLAVSGRDARLFASQGQQRAMVLALKLAEVEYLARRLNSPPILLLDDVSSELDSERTRLLFEAIAALGAQVWVSTTGVAALPLPPETVVLEVEAGVVRRVG